MLSVSSSYTKITEIEVLCVWVIAHCCCNTCSDYNRPSSFDSTCESLQLLFEDRQCCTLLEGKVEMFSQCHSRLKLRFDGHFTCQFLQIRIEFASVCQPIRCQHFQSQWL